MLPGKELFEGCCMNMDIPAKVRLLPGDTCTIPEHAEIPSLGLCRYCAAISSVVWRYAASQLQDESWCNISCTKLQVRARC